MENNKNKKSVKFQGDKLNFYDFIQVFVFTTNHHLKQMKNRIIMIVFIHKVDMSDKRGKKTKQADLNQYIYIYIYIYIYFKVKIPNQPKLLISQNKFSGPK